MALDRRRAVAVRGFSIIETASGTHTGYGEPWVHAFEAGNDPPPPPCGLAGLVCCKGNKKCVNALTCVNDMCVEATSSCNIGVPIVPSIPQCTNHFDQWDVNFQPVSGAVRYTVEYSFPTGKVTRTYDASQINEAYRIDPQGNPIPKAIWYFLTDSSFDPPKSPTESIQWRMRAETATCAGAYSKLSTVDFSASELCIHTGYGPGCDNQAPR